MKNTIKLALAAAAALAAATSAQAYSNGDLILGFDGLTTDFIYDLGKFNSLTVGETWNVGAAFGQNNLGSRFGVVGASAAPSASSHIFVTSSDSAENGFVQTSGQFASGNVSTIGGTLVAGGTRTPTPTDTTGWTVQTDSTGAGNTFVNNYFNPNVPVGSTAFFFNNANNNSQAAGLFNYDPNTGILSFVPEPSTYGVIAGLGLLAVMIRRRFAYVS